MNAPVPTADGKITLFPQQHVRRQVGKAVGHLFPAVILVVGVIPLFSGTEPPTLLAWVEVIAGFTYLVLMGQELRHLRQAPFHQQRIAWLELAAAAILALESYHLWHRHHEAERAGAPPRLHLLPWVYAVVAALYVVLAFCFSTLIQRRYVQLSADGFAVRTSLFAPVQQVQWAHLAAIEPVSQSGLRLHYTTGQTTSLSFEGFQDAVAHRDRLLQHVQTALGSELGPAGT